MLICAIGMTDIIRSSWLSFLLIFVRQNLVPGPHLICKIHKLARHEEHMNLTSTDIEAKRTWSCSDKSPWDSKSSHKLNLNESFIVVGGVSRVRLMTCSPASDVRSNLKFPIVTWQSKVESDFAWIMFRTMTKIKARCRCNRRIMSGISKVYCVLEYLRVFIQRSFHM